MQLAKLETITQRNFTLTNGCKTLPSCEEFASLGEYIGSGSFGVVIGNKNYCVKLVDSGKLLDFEVRFSDWASRNGVGPKLICYGKMNVPHSLLDEWQMHAIANDFPVPKWLDMTSETLLTQLDYIAFERWETTLYDVLKRFELSAYLLEPIVPKFAQHLETLRKAGFVHGDLTPRNILVRMKDGQLVDVCFTDFADAFMTRAWFLNQYISDTFRALTIGCFTKLSFNQKLAQAIKKQCDRKSPEPVNITAAECFRRWLLFNPHNLDRCVLACLLYTLDIPYPIKIPTVFNFNLGWDDRGRLEVLVCFENSKEKHLVDGFKSIMHLRRDMNRWGNSRFRRLAFVTKAGKVIPASKEDDYFPSSFIMPDPNNYNQMCIFMQSVEINL